MSIFSIFKRKRIVDVDSWDNSPSNYEGVEDFARSSLINLNSGSSDTWTSDLVFLPVRRQKDSKNVYVKQAIQAASGGNGITSVRKPDNVAQSDFDAAIKNAAEEIIRAYGEWGGTAPDSVFGLAGVEPPTERAVAMNEVYNKVSEAMYLADYAEEEFTYIVDMYYDDTNNNFFLLAIRNGDVLRMDISYENGEVMLGEFTPVVIPDSLTARNNNLRVYRTKEGKRRWLQIASVATLNRVGEIDGTRLYDSFIAYADVTRNFPILNIYHLGPNSRVGQADLLARDEFVYLASGEFDDTPFADAVYNTLLNDETGYWGNSIEFDSYESYIENFDLDGINLQCRVHTVGINTAISILPERDAASLLTTYQRVNRGENMNARTKEALLELFKDPSLVEEFEEVVGRANGVAANSISRSAVEPDEEVVEAVEPEEAELEEVETEEEVEQPEETEETEEVEEVEEVETLVVELGEHFVSDLAESEEFRAALESGIEKSLNSRLAQLEERMKDLETQTEQLRSKTEEVRDWADDIPATKTKRAVVSYRARNNAQEATDGERRLTYAELADQTISEIFN